MGTRYVHQCWTRKFSSYPGLDSAWILNTINSLLFLGCSRLYPKKAPCPREFLWHVDLVSFFGDLENICHQLSPDQRFHQEYGPEGWIECDKKMGRKERFGCAEMIVFDSAWINRFDGHSRLIGFFKVVRNPHFGTIFFAHRKGLKMFFKVSWCFGSKAWDVFTVFKQKATQSWQSND